MRIFGAVLAALLVTLPAAGRDRPTGQPLVLSNITTEQTVPLAVLLPDGKTAQCVNIRFHWDPGSNVKADDDAVSFTLDVPATNPGAAIFTAQLWNASLASALAWQQPWQGARWKILQTPSTDGSGIDAALAVGMIATSARRPYPKETVVIANLHPDGSLGAVSHLVERMDAAAGAGITRIIIPSVQRFDRDAAGQVVNIVRHATELHVECLAADTLVDATELTMNDPLPDAAPDTTPPKYGNDLSDYIEGFARREQIAVANGLTFAPRPGELSRYPARQAATWTSVYADRDAGEEALRTGQFYVAYQLFITANARMRGLNALAGQTRANFNVKNALAAADELRQRLHVLMTPPTIDKGELTSAVLVAEMADWAYEVDALLEGAELVTKQTYSQRSDATLAESDRARESILSASEEARCLLNESDFYLGLLPHLATGDEQVADVNASHLLPQLIPAQLAIAQIFSDGIRSRATELRDGLLFDPRLVAYISVLRETKADWDAREHKKQQDAEAALTTKLGQGISGNSSSSGGGVEFDPGQSFHAPHTVLVTTSTEKKASDVALCLIWVDHDCEIAALDAKYLRLGGALDPATHEWKFSDRAKLDALLQAAEIGARQGIYFADKAHVDTSVLSMIYERATHQRLHGDDDAALGALRNYWRCALLGNLCWQLAHSHKAEAVEISADGKETKPGDKKPGEKSKPEKETPEKTPEKPETVAEKPAPAKPVEGTKGNGPHPQTTVVIPPVPATNAAPVVTNIVEVPVAPVATNTAPVVLPPAQVVETPEKSPATNSEASVPVAPIATNEAPVVPIAPVVPVAPVAHEKPAPRALPVDMSELTNTPSAATNAGGVAPVAPVAKDADLTGGESSGSTTNAPPVIGPALPPSGGTPSNP